MKTDPARVLAVARVVPEHEVPLDRPGIAGDVEPDIRLVGQERLGQRRVAEPQPAAVDLDEEPMSGSSRMIGLSVS